MIAARLPPLSGPSLKCSVYGDHNEDQPGGTTDGDKRRVNVQELGALGIRPLEGLYGVLHRSGVGLLGTEAVVDGDDHGVGPCMPR